MVATMKKYIFVLPTLIFLLLGCGPDIYVKDVDMESRPPNTGQIDIYKSAEEVKQPYKTIKILRAEDDRIAANQDEEHTLVDIGGLLEKIYSASYP